MLFQAARSQALALTVRCRKLHAVCALPDQAFRKMRGGWRQNHIRSSLLMVLEDTATVSTAKLASSGPPEDRESLSSASTQTLARSQWVCVPVDDCATLESCSTFARVGRCLHRTKFGETVITGAQL